MATEPAAHFLDRLAAASIDSYPGVGLGTDLRLSAPQVAGGALVHDGKLIHLVAFRRSGRAGPAAFGQTDDGEVRSSVNTSLSGRRYARMQQRDLNRTRKEDGDKENS